MKYNFVIPIGETTILFLHVVHFLQSDIKILKNSKDTDAIESIKLLRKVFYELYKLSDRLANLNQNPIRSLRM